MKIIKANAWIEDEINGMDILKKIEKAGRVCYKSEDRITEDSAIRFVKNILNRGHESVIEHISVTARFICDRGVTHEIVRHRIASYSQESTRYVNYGNEKNELTFIKPCFWEENSSNLSIWKASMKAVEQDYLTLLELGSTPQEARSVLPNSTKTEIVVTMNLREWRHFFKLRTSKAAHPQMREVANILLDDFKSKISVIFDDIEPYIS